MSLHADKAVKAQRAWKRMTIQMMEWVDFMTQKLSAVDALARAHPRRRKEKEREEAERAAAGCRHPPHRIRRGGNQYASYETCMECGARISYEAKSHGEKTKKEKSVEEKMRAASRCTQPTSGPTREYKPKKQTTTAATVEDGSWELLSGDL